MFDAEGNPLYGASIIIEKTTQGTTTDQNGEFSMKTTASFPFNIVVSFIGYESQTYEVLDLNFNKISLVPGNEFDEIIVSASRKEE